MSAPDLVPVTTHSRRLRHYARPADLGPSGFGGRDGASLCNNTIFTVVYDQDAMDGIADKYRHWSVTGRRVVIAEMPECKRCAKKATAAPTH